MKFEEEYNGIPAALPGLRRLVGVIYMSRSSSLTIILWFTVALWSHTGRPRCQLIHAAWQGWGRRVNSLKPSDAILPLISWLTLLRVMACLLTAPRHCPNQFWLTNNEVPQQILQSNIHVILNISIQKPSLNCTHFKSQPHILVEMS